MHRHELASRLKSKKAPVILDVRSAIEYRGGHIPEAIHSPAWKILFRRVPLPADKNLELVVTCEHGPRAQLAKSLLGLLGYRNVTLLEGHMAGWKNAGYPLVRQ